jgi:dCMP deaminase
MDMAIVIAQRSHDAETKVGAVLVNNSSFAVIATGFNGFIRSANDAILPNTRPAKYEYIVHAEQNLLCNTSRHGISTNDCSLICTLSPCKLCMRLLWNSGITKVICKDLYKDFDEIKKMQDIKVEANQEDDGFWHITYKVDKV